LISERKYHILCRFRSDPLERNGLNAEENEVFLEKLITPAEYSIDGGLNVTAWKLTSAGLDALEEFERMRDEKTKDEVHKTLQDKAAIGQVLVPLVTFFGGLVIEHWTGIVGRVLSLLGG